MSGTDDFTYHLAREDGCVVVSLAGELDMATAPELAECLERLSRNDERTVVLDVAELRFLDSSGLKVLLAAQQRAQAHGGTVTVRSPNDMVQRLLAMTNLEGVFGVEEQQTG
ncbi:MAG: STAS domain-containing protein [Actinobacteria bacterium]|nr:STAS domain-containing protein [Actinomycetota bacterium]